MKKRIIPLVPALIPALLLSCASTRPAPLQEQSPVAFITIYGNPNVPWYEAEQSGSTYSVQQTEEGLLTGLVNKGLDRDNPEYTQTQERIDYAARLLSQKLQDVGIAVIDPVSFADSPAYRRAGRHVIDTAASHIPATGYKAIVNASGKLNRDMARATGARSMFYLRFTFQKAPVMDGLHTEGVAARVVLSAYGVDSEGHLIVNRDYAAVSGESVEFLSGGKWDRDGLCALFPEATEAVIQQFIMDVAYPSGDERELQKEAVPIRVQTPQSAPETAGRERQQETARRLLAAGFTVEEAAELTGLAPEEIEALTE